MNRVIEPLGPGHLREIKHKARHRKKAPCGNPPATPTGVTVTFTATEALTHLRFTGKVKWNEVTTDAQGHASRPDEYEVQYRAVNAAGVPQELEDGKTKHRVVRRLAPQHLRLEAATNPTGSTFRFDTRRDHNVAVGDAVKITECESPATYNGTYVVTAVPNSTRFEVTGAASGVAACDDPGFETDDNDGHHVILRSLPRPKTWYWQARVRAVDHDGCAGDWSAWTAPGLPWTGADPKPPVPTGLQLDFDKLEKHRRSRWQGYLTWNEVTNFDYPGTPADDEDDLHAYAWQIQLSEDGIVGDDRKLGGVRLAKDADADTTVTQRFRVRNKTWWRRARVRSIDRFNRRGDWSDWTSWQRPADETPPAPTNVTIFDKATDRVPVVWDAPNDPSDGDLIHVDVDHFVCELSTSPTFGTTYKKHRFISGERTGFKIPKADLGPFFYARVRSVNSDDEKSAWIPAKIAGNSSSAASADGVKPGRSKRIAATFTASGDVVAQRYPQGFIADRKYTIVGARARVGDHDAATHPVDGTPGGTDMLINLRIKDDAGTDVNVFTADTKLRIDNGTHKDTSWIVEGDTGFNRTYIDTNETMYVKVSQIGSTRAGSDLVVVVVLEPDPDS